MFFIVCMEERTNWYYWTLDIKRNKIVITIYSNFFGCLIKNGSGFHELSFFCVYFEN